MTTLNDLEVSIKEETESTFMGKPHVLLLGAGASKEALPNGDKNGKPVPILRELATELKIFQYFPKDLQELSKSDFEAAYSKLFNRGQSKSLQEINNLVSEYFSELELPDQVNLYDMLHLTLREKDVIATFNWDPFLMQSRIRLCKLGVIKFPKLFFPCS